MKVDVVWEYYSLYTILGLHGAFRNITPCISEKALYLSKQGYSSSRYTSSLYTYEDHRGSGSGDQRALYEDHRGSGSGDQRALSSTKSHVLHTNLGP